MPTSSEWRQAISTTILDCFLTGQRTLSCGASNNPFTLQLLRAGQPFSDDDPSSAIALEAGLYARAPLETRWQRISDSTNDGIIESLIALLAHLPERALIEAYDEATLTLQARVRRIRDMARAASPYDGREIVLRIPPPGR